MIPTISSVKKFLSYASLMTLVALSGCFYAPDEEVFTDVEKPNPVGMISLSDYDDGDTIVLFTAADFYFNVGTTQGKIKEVSVVLSGSELYEGEGPSGTFSIRDNNLKTGIYDLQIEFISSSETGSLLDKLGGELFKVWRKWVVKIDRDPPPTPVLEVVPNTNFLTLRWKPYLKANFVSYEFVDYKVGKRIIIDDPHVTSWVDSTYVSGSASYHLTVRNILYSRSTEKTVNYPQQVQVDYTSEDSTALITWRKLPFTGAFKGMEILENEDSRVTITSASDTTLALKLKHVVMGRRSMIDLQLHGKYVASPVFSYRHWIDNPLALKRLENTAILDYSLGLNNLIGFNSSDNQLKVFDADLNVIATDISTWGAPYVPSSGQYVYFKSLFELIRKDFQTKELRFITASKRNSGPARILAYSAGGNGNVIFTFIDDSEIYEPEYHTRIYNINSGVLIHSSKSYYDPKSGYYPAPLMSGDGRFVYRSNNRTIFEIEADTLKEVGYIPLIGSFVGFRQDNNEEIFLSDASSILLCSTLDFSVLKTIPKPESGYTFKNYDPATKNILFVKSTATRAYLVNAETDAVKVLSVYGDAYRFYNGILFDDQQGYYLKVF